MKKADEVYNEEDRKLFLDSLKKGKIIIGDVEKTTEGTKYYYIQKIC